MAHAHDLAARPPEGPAPLPPPYTWIALKHNGQVGQVLPYENFGRAYVPVRFPPPPGSPSGFCDVWRICCPDQFTIVRYETADEQRKRTEALRRFEEQLNGRSQLR